MDAKCNEPNCEYVEDVAHMDAALESLSLHYRAVHPTKWFRKTDAAQRLEGWNRTVDEWLEMVSTADGTVDYRYLNEYLRGYMGAPHLVMPEATRTALQALYDEHQAANQRVNAAQDAALDLDGVVEQQDALLQDAALDLGVPPARFPAPMRPRRGGVPLPGRRRN